MRAKFQRDSKGCCYDSLQKDWALYRRKQKPSLSRLTSTNVEPLQKLSEITDT